MFKKLDELKKKLELFKEELHLSNYGPKSAKLYSVPDNAKRKESRTGDVVEGIGQNKAVRSYSTKPGQMSAKQQANAEQKKVKKLSGPVTHPVLSDEEKAKYLSSVKKDEDSDQQ